MKHHLLLVILPNKYSINTSLLHIHNSLRYQGKSVLQYTLYPMPETSEVN